MILLYILGFACLAHVVADFGIHLNLPQKPFQCDMCMGFWLSFIPLTIMYGFLGLVSSGIVAVLADVIYRLKEKL